MLTVLLIGNVVRAEAEVFDADGEPDTPATATFIFQHEDSDDSTEVAGTITDNVAVGLHEPDTAGVWTVRVNTTGPVAADEGTIQINASGIEE